jgi:aminomethyltransferase
MLTGTPLHARTFPLCEPHNWRRWSGHIVAGSYEMTHDREYAAIRNAAALLDLSPLRKYHLTGKDSAALLDRVVTRDVLKSKVGQVLYTPWCDEHGKVIDDGTIHRLEADFFRMTSAEPNLRWLTLNAFGLDVNIADVSDQIVTLGLQGPRSREVLKQCVTGADLDALKYFRVTKARIGNTPVEISRTGYTGDLGYEIWIPSDQRALEAWDAILEAGRNYGIVPTGILALDVARIEAGLIMIDVDYTSAHKAFIDSKKSSPFELSLDWTVNLAKESFNGKQALIAEKERGSTWRFVGIDVDYLSLEALYAAHKLSPQLPIVAWRQSTPLYADGRWIGYATSGVWSPLLKKYIALAHVEAKYAAPGTPIEMEVTVEHQRKTAKAVVAKLPFFDPERKKH